MVYMISDIPTLVGREDSESMDSTISEEEIKKEIWSLHPDKAPRLDGFSICFYRKCWYLTKKYLARLLT